MKIAIAGAGAMGSRFGLMLHQSGNEVLLIVAGQNMSNKSKNMDYKQILMVKR